MKKSSKSGGQPKTGKPVRTAMGRAVQHHSPDKHVEQDDPMPDQYDQMLNSLDSGDVAPANVTEMRKALKGSQVPAAPAAQRLQGWLDAISGKKR